ncbi:hypothetical protein ZWY2020_000778 [Hordeum vulgare]|nr:hypothetical protein ZWY2020_000778 [Hordeum vulgare]
MVAEAPGKSQRSRGIPTSVRTAASRSDDGCCAPRRTGQFQASPPRMIDLPRKRWPARAIHWRKWRLLCHCDTINRRKRNPIGTVRCMPTLAPALLSSGRSTLPAVRAAGRQAGSSRLHRNLELRAQDLLRPVTLGQYIHT